MSALNKDLAGKNYWNEVYQKADAHFAPWQPVLYTDLVIKKYLLGTIKKCAPGKILEIGCGNSDWITYLGQVSGAEMHGIDYSPIGCELIERKLAQFNIRSKIHCADVFEISPEQTGFFDVVYSLGVAEHFSNLTEIVDQHRKFLKPGGTLYIQIPNLVSFHGVLCWFHQPRVFAKHKVLSLSDLKKALRQTGLSDIQGRYIGLFSLNIVDWGNMPRFPRISRKLVPYIRKIVLSTDRLMRKTDLFAGFYGFSSYIYVTGKVKQ